jgi:hypothetical protein
MQKPQRHALAVAVPIELLLPGAREARVHEEEEILTSDPWGIHALRR